MNKMYLVLGDWSKDGHGQSQKVLLEADLTVKEMQEAYKEACKLTDLAFDDDQKTKYVIAAEYEDNKISKKCANILKKFGIKLNYICEKDEENKYYLDSESFVALWINFVKIARPDAKIRLIDCNIPNINGYWDENLNTGFGYGLYF